MFKEGWVQVNGIPTHVQTWGGWIEDEITSSSVIVCIPGNPGITGFYCVFLSALHEQTNLPVWVINHAGLEFPPESEDMKMPSLRANPQLYDLEGQIIHKLKFIQRYAQNDMKLHLIGHSVGGKMVAGVLKEPGLIPRINQAYFLFPTLEYIAKSPFGKAHVKYSKYIHHISLFLIWFISCFPMMLKRWLVVTYLKLSRKALIVESCVDAALKVINPKVLKAVLFLSVDEMKSINELDVDVMMELGERANCYYGHNDGWAPLWQSEDVKKLCPKANVTVLDPSHKHAFVLSSPKEIARILSEHISATSQKHL